jgi:hypothetical protein
MKFAKTLAFAAIFCSLSLSAAAQPSRPFFFTVRYTPSVLLETDFDGEEGQVTKIQHDVTGTLTVPVPQRGIINASTSHDRHRIQFRDTGVVDGLLEDASSTRIDLAYIGRLAGKWSTFSMASVSWNIEEGANFADGRTEALRLMAQRKVSESVELGFGLAGSTRLDRSDQIHPMASINWQITDRLALRTTRGVQLVYDLDETAKWRLAFNGEYSSREMRLDEDGLGEGGVYRNRLYVTSIGLLHRPNPGMSFGFELGYVPWRDVRIQDRNRETIFRARTEPGISAAATISIGF